MKLPATNTSRNYTPLVIFAVAMGFLEAIVVVYIRELYYPEGFQFPLKALPEWLIVVELVRELTTLLMLSAVAWISGKLFLNRLSAFLFLFGIWDIFYYIALYIFLGWPESLLTWDILFLIPITWVGPVLAPVICSVLMIIMAIVFDYLHIKKNLTNLQTIELILIFAGAAVIYFTFTVDFGIILFKGNFLSQLSTLAENHDFLKILTSWKPTRFNWEIFAVGLIIICIGFYLIIRRGLRT